jgi:hypothetical protein
MHSINDPNPQMILTGEVAADKNYCEEGNNDIYYWDPDCISSGDPNSDEDEVSYSDDDEPEKEWPRDYCKCYRRLGDNKSNILIANRNVAVINFNYTTEGKVFYGSYDSRNRVVKLSDFEMAPDNTISIFDQPNGGIFNITPEEYKLSRVLYHKNLNANKQIYGYERAYALENTASDSHKPVYMIDFRGFTDFNETNCKKMSSYYDSVIGSTVNFNTGVTCDDTADKMYINSFHKTFQDGNSPASSGSENAYEMFKNIISSTILINWK